MKKSTNLIYYPPGCYGTFFEWAYKFFNKNSLIHTFPFRKDGSSHDFNGNFKISVEFEPYLNSDEELDVIRIHPGVFSTVNSNEVFYKNSYYDLVKTDLTFIRENFKKTLVLHPTKSQMHWVMNNLTDKLCMTEEEFNVRFKPLGYTKEYISDAFVRDEVLKHKLALQSELSQVNVSQWQKNSIMDFDVWELRELMSLYWFVREKDLFACWDDLILEFADIKFISMGELKNNFQKTILNYLDYFEVDVDQDKLCKLPELESQWRSLQPHINKDQLVNDIVDSILENKNLDWSGEKISLTDEAFIQKRLSDQGRQIKCWNLNVFPTNTKDFSPLIEGA
jgi:hypothetical protein